MEISVKTKAGWKGIVWMGEREKSFFFIDALRALAVLLILNSHMDKIYPIQALATGGALGNSLFFICSGYCIRGKNKTGGWIFWKLVRLYVPAAIVTFLFYRDSQAHPFSKYVWPTCFWFVGAMVLFYIAYDILERLHLFEHYKLFLAIGIIFYAGYYILLLDTGGWVIEAPGITSIEGCFKLIYYFMIMFTGGYIKQKKNIRGNIGLYKAAILFSVVLLYGSKYIFNKYSDLIHWQFLNQVFVFVFAAAMLIVFRESNCLDHFGNRKEAGLFKYLGRYSLEIYLVQFTVIEAVEKFSFPGNLIMAVGLSLIMGFILKQICTIPEKILEYGRQVMVEKRK